MESYSTTIILVFLAIVTLLTGYWFYYDPPKNINFFFGYRTKKAMKDQQRWDFAHNFSGKLFLWFGLGLILLALLAYIINLNGDVANVVVAILFGIGTLIIIYWTEKALGKKFKD
ncbi:SdpI family protein [Aequorivita sp. H23M31]|uniref:SdpI family protein n=1 Tax=Aequorivita ciconiae TaxID=2494375 RepID=A0A410G1M5_9FLAO|nr:SdpI family protein [Aequorivita sp. H23M31]QAA81145.1 SdpI family protein [Aequorivita sp. H23M31]